MAPYPADPFASDEAFDRLLPPDLRSFSRNQWTPVAIVHEAAAFLADQENAKILDIGSGVGKFCLAGAHNFPRAEFHGIEQRINLHNAAQSIQSITKIANAHFEQGDILGKSFNDFNGFYFFNSFSENLVYGAANDLNDEDQEITDLEISYDVPDLAADRYLDYSAYVCRALDSRPAGTRLVTFFGEATEVPKSYRLVYSGHNSRLRFWVRI